MHHYDTLGTLPFIRFRRAYLTQHAGLFVLCCRLLPASVLSAAAVSSRAPRLSVLERGAGVGDAGHSLRTICTTTTHSVRFQPFRRAARA